MTGTTYGLANVRDCGAVGDGVVDDTAAIQSAIDQGGAFVPPGIYRITSPLRLDQPGWALIGSHRSLAKLVYEAPANDKPAISITASDCIVRGLGIDGTANATAAGETIPNCNDVEVMNADRATIEANEIVGGHYGIELDNTVDDPSTFTVNRDHQVRGNRLRGTFGGGVHIDHGCGISILDNQAIECRQDGFKTGGNAQSLRIIGNKAEGCTRDGFDFFDGLIGSTVSSNTAIGNMLFGFEVKGTFGGTFGDDDYVVRQTCFAANVAESNARDGFSLISLRAMSFDGNLAVANLERGFTLINLQNCSFAGDVATRNHKHGFLLQAGSTKLAMASCGAIDNSWDDGLVQNGLYHGFRIDPGCTAELAACYAYNSSLTGKKGGQGYGISIGDGVSSAAACNFLGNVTGGIDNVAFIRVVNVRDNGGQYLNSFEEWIDAPSGVITGYVGFVDSSGITRKIATIE